MHFQTFINALMHWLAWNIYLLSRRGKTDEHGDNYTFILTGIYPLSETVSH